MKIKVWNNEELVFTGEAEEYLNINDYDEDVKQQINEAEKVGYSVKEVFVSGRWTIIKL